MENLNYFLVKEIFSTAKKIKTSLCVLGDLKSEVEDRIDLDVTPMSFAVAEIHRPNQTLLKAQRKIHKIRSLVRKTQAMLEDFIAEKKKKDIYEDGVSECSDDDVVLSPTTFVDNGSRVEVLKRVYNIFPKEQEDQDYYYLQSLFPTESDPPVAVDVGKGSVSENGADSVPAVVSLNHLPPI
jgi:hypothetical protein